MIVCRCDIWVEPCTCGATAKKAVVTAFANKYLDHYKKVEAANLLCKDTNKTAWLSFLCCDTHKSLTVEYAAIRREAVQLYRPGIDPTIRNQPIGILSPRWWQEIGRQDIYEMLMP